MREVDVKAVRDAVADAFEEINYRLPRDVSRALSEAEKAETSALAREVLAQINENRKVAAEEAIPICQDTGMAVVFMEVGQEVRFTGGSVRDAVNEGVRIGYERGYLRKSVVSDPIYRTNTGDNTPAVIHFELTDGENVKLTVTAKGFGSENKSRLFMLKPADGVEGVKAAVLETVREAGASACPPMTVGVGIGGDFEKCAIMAKHALTRDVAENNPDERYAALERELLEAVNATGIGPAGLGGATTALAVNVEAFPTHIAGLPVAVNVCCHVNRHKTIII